ncbi:MAG: Gfo/Idh/MocA family oxidoreductase [Phycisphaerae bacterium]|jgi:predicted dehydrogenase|nr:Gfo/Idh/MocA family oxidoreductase [Phycisphaerae bacterium]
MKKLRIGVAGLRRGSGFAKLVSSRPDCRLVAVCDRNIDRAREVAGMVQVEPYDDYDRFCQQEMDAVIIVTPPSTHFECTIKAMEAGNHVLCEIPAVVSVEEAEVLVKKVKASGLIYMAAENVCYFPIIQEMHRRVQEGQIGNVILAEGEYIHDCRQIMLNRDDGLGGGMENIPSWRAHFDPIQYSTHELGPFLMIMEDRIVSVSCMESTNRDDLEPGTLQIQSAVFQTAAGRVIRELTSFKIVREPPHHFYCLYGTRGSMETDRYHGETNLKLYVKSQNVQNQMTDIPVSPIHQGLPPEALAGGHGTSEFIMVNDFVQAIKDGKSPLLDLSMAIRMTLPGIYAAKSARQGGERIVIPDLLKS